MIVLTQNTTNQVTATLQEKQISSGSSYLLQLVNDQSKEQLYTVVYDESASPLSFQTFFINLVTGSASYLNSEINPDLPGFYHYSFFEGTGSGSPTSSLGLNVLESGKVLVIQNATSSIPAFTSSYSPSAVFNPADYQS